MRRDSRRSGRVRPCRREFLLAGPYHDPVTTPGQPIPATSSTPPEPVPASVSPSPPRLAAPPEPDAVSSSGPAYAPGPGSGESSGRRRWLAVGATVWALVLLGGVAVSYDRDDDASVREQRSIAKAAPVVAQAVGELVAAADGDDVVLEVSDPRLTDGCRLTPAWDGAALDQDVTVHTTESAEADVLVRVADRLPAGYRAQVRSVHRADDRQRHRLRAEADRFVVLTGRSTTPGVVTFTVSTGCRPQSAGFDGPASPPPALGGEVDAVRSVMAGPAEIVGGAEVPCPAGSVVARTHRLTGPGRLGPVERERLRQSFPVVVLDTADEYAVRAGTVSVRLRMADGRLAADVTTGCRPTSGR